MTAIHIPDGPPDRVAVRRAVGNGASFVACALILSVLVACGVRKTPPPPPPPQLETTAPPLPVLPDKPLTPDLASAYTAMGRGMISLGEIDKAMGYLRKSLNERVTLGALPISPSGWRARPGWSAI